MIYRFNFDGKVFDIVEQFVRFAETLKSTMYIKVDWKRKETNRTEAVQTGYVDIMCSRKDEEELFYWLKIRDIRVRIKYLTGKDVN